MATRLYGVATTAAPISPGFTQDGTWASTTGAVRRNLSTSKAAGTETRSNVAVTSGSGNETLAFQLISDTLDVDQTISGTVTIMTRGRELAASDNIGARVRKIWVVQSDGTTIRGSACLALGNHSVTTELGTTVAGYQAASATAITTVNALAGDRIVVELGYGMTTTGTTPLYDMVIGGNGTDHANAATDSTGTVPWIEFSADLTFGTPAVAPFFYPDADASSPAVVKATSSNAVTTASFTPPSNSVIVVGFTSDQQDNDTAASTITDNTGGALTWTNHANRRSNNPSGADDGKAALWTAKVTSSPGAMTITCDDAEVSSVPKMLIVRVYAGTEVDIDDPIGGLVQASIAASSSTVQASVTPETHDGGLRLLVLDWNATGVPTSFLPNGTETGIVDSSHNAGLSTNVQIGKSTRTVLGTAETVGYTVLSGTTSDGNYIAYELRSSPDYAHLGLPGENIETSDATTSHDIVLPSGLTTGNLLIMGIAIDGDPSITVPTGWVQLGQGSVSGAINGGAWYRWVDGNEDNDLTWESSAGGQSTTRVWQVFNAHATIPPEMASTTATNAAPDAGSLTPSGWEQDDVLWMWMLSCDGRPSDAGGVTLPPTGYQGLTNAGGTGAAAATQAMAFKRSNATSENPAAATIFTSQQHFVGLIAIPPADASAGVGEVTLTPATAASSARSAVFLRELTPLAAYNFDEGSGTTAADSSGNGRNITAAHTTNSWNASGHTDDAIHNTGASGGATGSMGANTSLTDWSISFWARREGTWSGWASPFGASAGSWYVEVNAGSSYVTNFYGGTNSNTTGPTMTQDVWYHFAVTRNASGTIFYVDGVATGSAVSNGAHNFNPNHVVAGLPSGEDSTWNGSVDDLRIFDVSLSLAEINYYMNTPVESGIPSVILTEATTASSAQAVVSTPNHNLTPATAASSAQSIDPTTIVTLTQAEAVSSARAVVSTPNVNLTPAVATASAQAIDPTTLVTLTQAIAASSAVVLTLTPVVSLTPAVATSSAEAVDPTAVVTISPASAATSAVVLTLTPVVGLAPATVASSAQALTLTPVVALTPAVAASSAQAVDPTAVVTLTQADAVSSARAVVSTPNVNLSFAVATASAQAVDPYVELVLTPAIVTSSAQALTLTPIVNLTPAVAVSSAESVDPTTVFTIGVASVTSSAQALTLTPVVGLTPAVTTASAQAVDPTTTLVLTQATVASSAQSITLTPYAVLSPAVATSSAESVDPTAVVTLSPASVATSAVALTITPVVGLTQGMTIASAVALTITPVVALTPAVAASSAVAPTITPVVELTPAVAPSSAVALTLTPVVNLTPATASTAAQALTLVQTVVLTPATATTAARAMTSIPEVDLTRAAMATSAVALTITPVVGLTPATTAASAQSIDPTSVVTISPAVATATAEAVDPTSVVPLSPATLTASAQVIDPTAVVSLSAAVASSSAVSPVFTPNVNLGVASAATSARLLTLSAHAGLSPATAATSAEALTLTPVVALSPATVDSLARIVALSSTGSTSLIPAETFATAPALTLVQTVVLSPAVATTSAVAPTQTPVVSLSVASVASAAPSLTLTPVVGLSPATAASSASQLSLTPAVLLTPAEATTAALALTLVQSVVLSPAVLAAAAQITSLTGSGSVSLIPAAISTEAPPLVATPIVLLNASGVAATGVALTFTPIVGLTPATVSAVAVPVTLVPVVQLNAAGATVSARYISFPGDRGPGDTYMVLGGVEVPLLFKAAMGGVLVDASWTPVSS